MSKKQWFDDDDRFDPDDVGSFAGTIFMGFCLAIGILVLVAIW